MIQGLYGKSNIMEKALNASIARNDAISQNIANVDTPNYKRKDVAFEQYFADSLNRANMNDVDDIQPTIIEDKSDNKMRIDGNNVDIDSEMSYLAKNTIKYNALVQLINSNFSRIKNVIREGK
ncbi:flagellar basal body rod protein FlgB [Ruminiclostridium herbifermentans]|uniref:Flagellar basal body rod protein FlgB n=1 Tax=Ruminiclostridium herbifermentans TaxID=2488810 RepID=A0A4U7JLH8_9FIRM|nr:flagellar basal body rod protein FlgB [Ruminiclostridium herbifermentans]QNU68382.1 flagellar basal body rod protein FlgB [Ruminiclostridium herbifermentans]